jgi:hypothetical protein
MMLQQDVMAGGAGAHQDASGLGGEPGQLHLEPKKKRFSWGGRKSKSSKIHAGGDSAEGSAALCGGGAAGPGGSGSTAAVDSAGRPLQAAPQFGSAMDLATLLAAGRRGEGATAGASAGASVGSGGGGGGGGGGGAGGAGALPIEEDAAFNAAIAEAAAAALAAEADDVLLSQVPGLLEITRRGLFWTPVYDGVPPPPLTHTMTPEDASQRDCVIVLFAQLKRHTFRAMGPAPTSPRYLLLHTDHSIRLFPLPPAEAEQLALLLEDLTGRAQFDERAYIDEIVAERIARRRVKVLANLTALNPGGEWIIDNNSELMKVMGRLTNSARPQSMYDIERVYHSCRLNAEVTKEAIIHLRHRWNEAKDESVRKKVLMVVDRLMDRAVMRHGSPNFSTLTGWVRRLGERIDPYTSPDSTNILRSLVERIEEFKTQAVTGIPLNQFEDHFERLGDLQQLRESVAGTADARSGVVHEI